jgi:hypothetical protein
MCCLLAACGRLHFDAREAADAGTDGVPAACARNPVAPDPVTIAGTTFRYGSSTNTPRTALAGVSVSALDMPNGAVLATTTSDAMGQYTLNVQTAGTPPTIVLAYVLTGYFQTQVTLDRSVDRDIAGATKQVWTIGDGPLWNLTGMNMFYTAAGVPRDTTKGSLNIAVRDCAGQTVPGVTVVVSPAPQRLLYQADDGALLATGGTQPLFSTVFAVNAQPGINTITATAPELTFAPITVDVGADQFNALAILHADPP